MKVNDRVKENFCEFSDLHVGDVFECDNRLFMKLGKYDNLDNLIVELKTGIITTMLPSEWVRKDCGEYILAFTSDY